MVKLLSVITKLFARYYNTGTESRNKAFLKEWVTLGENVRLKGYITDKSPRVAQNLKVQSSAEKMDI